MPVAEIYMKPVIERVLEKVLRIPFSGCWIFTGAVNGIKSIDVSMLASGVYYVLIGAEGKVPVYRKLVVMNQN